MASSARPYRSALYIPASNARAMEKAAALPADALIFDLEDAVALEMKAAARVALAEALETHDYGPRAKILRINGLGTGLAEADIAAIAPARPEAVLLPKAESAADVAALAGIMAGHDTLAETRIWAMIETPRGVLNALEIAEAPRMTGFVMGTNDLAKDLGSRATPERAALETALQMSLLAARAAGITAIDGVYNTFKDDAGLRAECEAGRDMGFDGKTLIHPAQLAVANEVFAPTEAEIDLARRQIEAFQAVTSEGGGVAVVDGSIVENLHVTAAKQTLAKAEAIRSMEVMK